LFCTASTILEDTLKDKIVEAINIAVSGKNSFLTILKKNIETVLSADLDESTADIDKRLEELQTELIQKANSKESYDNIVNEIYRLRDLRQETLSRNALRKDKRDRIAEMTDFLNTQTGDITEFDDKLVRKLVEKVIVYDNRLVVEFKSGFVVEVKCLCKMFVGKMGWRLRKTSEKEEREADPRNRVNGKKIHGGGFSSWNRFAKS